MTRDLLCVASVFLGFAVSFTAIGCDSSDTAALDRADRLTDIQRTQFGLDDEEESSTQAAPKLKLPADHPQDIAVFPRAEIKFIFGKSMRTIQMESTADAHQIMSFYRRELVKAGWRLTGNAAANIQARKGKRIVNVSLPARRDPEPDDPRIIALQYSM